MLLLFFFLSYGEGFMEVNLSNSLNICSLLYIKNISQKNPSEREGQLGKDINQSNCLGITWFIPTQVSVEMDSQKGFSLTLGLLLQAGLTPVSEEIRVVYETCRTALVQDEPADTQCPFPAASPVIQGTLTFVKFI